MGAAIEAHNQLWLCNLVLERAGSPFRLEFRLTDGGRFAVMRCHAEGDAEVRIATLDHATDCASYAQGFLHGASTVEMLLHEPRKLADYLDLGD